VGQFFLSGSQNLTAPSNPLVIEYGHLVATASGVILDIDGIGTGQLGATGNEQWTIRAYNGTTLLDTRILSAGDPGTGDGKATPWQFDFGTVNSINKLTIQYTGTKLARNVGFALDNFDTTVSTAPEPASMGLLGLGLISLLRRRARRQA
jgi:hypothetical protein